MSIEEAKSYTLTVENNKTEKSCVNDLIALDSSFIKVEKDEKREILKSLGMNDKKYIRSFDLIRKTDNGILLIEVKTTKKKLINFPSNFFFGVTQNEIDLAEQLPETYKFCFTDGKQFAIFSIAELNNKMKSKRTMFQVIIK